MTIIATVSKRLVAVFDRSTLRINFSQTDRCNSIRVRWANSLDILEFLSGDGIAAAAPDCADDLW